MDFAYYENNPYYTIKDITVVKLDFTDTGNRLISYLKSKFEVPLDNKISKLENVGVNKVSYACFKNGVPNDEAILKQILFLFEEQNDIIFVDKNVALVDETIVKERNYESNRVKGDIDYITNYFTDSGLFISKKLNSDTNILLESNLIYKVTELSDFIKDFTGGRSISSQLGNLRNAPPALDNRDIEAFRKQVDAANNIKTQVITNVPKVLGLVMSGIPLVAPLVKGTLDKLAQLKKQNDAKKLKEANAIGGIKGEDTPDVTTKDLFSPPNSLVSKYQSSVTLPSTNTNKTTTPPVVSTPRPIDPKIKEIQDKFNAEQAQIRSRDRAASLAGLGGDYDEDSFGNRTYDDPADTLKYQNTLAMLKK